MASSENDLSRIVEKLEMLTKRQENVSNEIKILRDELDKLLYADDKRLADFQAREAIKPEPLPSPESHSTDDPPVPEPKKRKPLDSEITETRHQTESVKPVQKVDSPPGRPKKKSDLEKFIGENLINKIGIAITVIGVGIGAKYSIDHGLISPLTRIILGYLSGLILLGVGMRLQKKYENFSAVLVSGSMAIMYFITFAAFSFYGLFSKEIAFALMLVFTVFTVLASIKYNQQVIALIGLVGAYAVPFLLSDGSGNVVILFSYMAIINVGILILAFKKYWKPVYYTAFILTWLIFIGWYSDRYYVDDYFAAAFIFNSLFFVIFYVTFLAYKIKKSEVFNGESVAMLLLNSFIFYALGYGILDSHEVGEQLLGPFTAGNALIHFVVSMVLFKRKQVDRNVFYLISGLVLVFVTLAIPVQLEGNWVTIIWSVEAALLFWIGRAKNVKVYEKLAFPLMILAFFSILHDWVWNYSYYIPEDSSTRVTPIFNIDFLTAAFFMASFGFIVWFNRKTAVVAAWPQGSKLNNILAYLIPTLLIFVSYFAFQIEIRVYFDQLITESRIELMPADSDYTSTYWDKDLENFKSIWIINYSLVFMAILSFINIKKLKQETFGYINLFFNALSITVFLVAGLYVISELRETYINPVLNENYVAGPFNLLIRYFSFLFLALTLYATFLYSKQKFIRLDLKLLYGFLLHISLLWVSSSELIHWLHLAGNEAEYKLALSILWGLYALMLVSLGIWKRKQYLRIGGFVLFSATLLKLFFYDISHLNTISKTIVFVSLGVLLLIISFLYNKFKINIADEKEE